MRPALILLAVLLSAAFAPCSLSINVGEDDYTSNFTTITRGGEHSAVSDIEGPSAVDQFGYGVVQSGDIEGKLGIMHLLAEAFLIPQMYVTRIFWPNPVIAGENETINTNTTVKINQTDTEVYMINITDQVPWDFTAPQASDVRVYFQEYSPYAVTDITGNATVSVSILDQSGSLPTLLMVNISNISQTDANTYMQENDSILLVYDMISSEMDAGDYRLVYTNVTVTDNVSQEGSGYFLGNITAFEVLLRGYKTISVPDLSNPQNLTVEIILKALGGPVSGIYIADYLPDGANVSGLNVTLYNSSKGEWVQLQNSSDYYIDLENPMDSVLPGGEHVDIYHYNFTHGCSAWDCNLYNNDTIRIIYNVTILGGGSWLLPTIMAGYDPQYQKHIKTEMYATANVPSFDVAVEIMTAMVSPGEAVKAILRMLNVGGPRAKVDVFVTYSAKTMQGELINEKSETFAVVESKEKELELKIPSSVRPGMYTFEAFVSYTGREALSTDTFEVLEASVEQPGYPLYVAIIALSLGAVFLLLRFRVSSRKTENILHCL